MKDTRIFIADRRLENRNDDAIIRSTVNFYDGEIDSSSINGTIHQINECVIFSSQQVAFTIPENTFHIILPLQADLAISIFNTRLKVAIGELLIVSSDSLEEMYVENLDENSSEAQFIQVVIDNNTVSRKVYKLQMPELLKANRNCLHVIAEHVLESNVVLSIGAFIGREENEWKRSFNSSEAIAMVLDGCFELSGRLLYQFDVMDLGDLKEVDLECLSSQGILFFIEL